MTDTERDALIAAADAMTADEVHQHPFAALDKIRGLTRELRAAAARVPVVVDDAMVERIRRLHRPGHPVFNWARGLRYDEPCKTCQGKAGVHECGCWADEDVEFFCVECDRPTEGGARRGVRWPCPTVAALTPDGQENTQ